MGKEEGFIELELKGLPGQCNLTIMRELNMNMVRQQMFTVNGEKASGAKVSEQVKGLGIQMDNLWCVP